MPPLLVLLALLAHAWHGAPCPRHARFVAFDGGRCHRTPPRGAPYTGQPVIVAIKQSRWERHGTHIDGGRNHAVVLFYATGDRAEWGYFYIKIRVYIAKKKTFVR
jgi:hypothetical protein